MSGYVPDSGGDRARTPFDRHRAVYMALRYDTTPRPCAGGHAVDGVVDVTDVDDDGRISARYRATCARCGSGVRLYPDRV